MNGWSGYITSHSKVTGIVSDEEHALFLNMWLEKFIFYGSTADLTTNMLVFAEHLAQDNKIPLGKLLLGSVYRLMHQTTIKLRVGETISTGGPCWFIQLWLTVYIAKGQGIDLPSCTFPNNNTEGESHNMV